MKIQFLGAAGTVTGSKSLIEYRGRRLLVDCGLFQGVKQLRLRNWRDLPVPASQIDAVVLTHAHLDHSGFLPRLAKLGFRGKVHATGATVELAELLLEDAAHLNEEEAAYANRHGFSRHQPALPLFTREDVQRLLKQFVPHEFDVAFEPLPGLVAHLSAAGHILGAASVHLQAQDRSVLFSGDLGRVDDAVMIPPAKPRAADLVVIESTYGDRLHPQVDPLDELASAIGRTAARGGIVLVPAFAVGRAQELLHALQQLKTAGRIPDLPIYLNSPMAARATRLYLRWSKLHRLSAEDCERIVEGTRIVETVEESKRLNSLHYPSVIVSASGMLTGGRVLHHVVAYGGDARNTIILPGFQAPGTRGAALMGGSPTLKIYGQYVPVRAEIVPMASLSAHADRDGLLGWLGQLPSAPNEVCVNHGEATAADALRLAIEERYRWSARVPEESEVIELR